MVRKRESSISGRRVRELLDVSSCAGLSDARAATQVLVGADGRRPTSAKARNRGGEAAAMVAQLYGDLRPVERAVASSFDSVSGGPADAG
jgi:hypothetical protein